MTGDSGDFLPLLGDIFQAVTHSALFVVLKWFLMIYAIVLFFDVVFLLLLRGVTANLKTQIYGTERPFASKDKILKRWEKIVARLDGQSLSQYKVAVLEADQLADELLAGIGYGGKNMGERLGNIHPGQVESLADLKEAHATRNRVVNEPNFSLSQDEAKMLLEAYRRFFVELELL